MNHFNFTGNNFDFLYKQDFEVVLPGKPTIEHTVIPAIEALNRKDYGRGTEPVKNCAIGSSG